MRTHFIEIMDKRGPSRSAHPRLQYEIGSNVVALIHSFNVREKKENPNSIGLALAFPSLVGENDLIFPLNKIRIFAEEEEIRKFFPRVQAMLLEKTRVETSNIQEIGQRRWQHVCGFVRSQKPGKNTLAAQERLATRAQRKYMEAIKQGKGERPLPLSLTERIQKMNINSQEEIRNIYFKIKSSSTSRDFSLFVEAVSRTDNSSETVNSYGLSSKESVVLLPHF